MSYYKQYKDVDDLELVPCSHCGGKGQGVKDRRTSTGTCPVCKGDGLNLVHMLKFFTVKIKTRRSEKD